VRNRDRVIAAARAVFLRDGAGAALDAVGERAGVGIATVYRHFAGRPALVEAVVLDALARAADAAERAAALAAPGGEAAFDALVGYLHEIVDLEVAAVVPVLAGHVDLGRAEPARLRDRAATAVTRLLASAHEAGVVHPDLTFGDIGLLLVRLSRPLPGGFGDELDRRIAHRQVDIAVAGLRHVPGGRARPLPPPAVELADIRRITG
jgi:AcrR family transcriptional regulator